MGLLPNTQNCGLRMRRECRERFPRIEFKGNRLLAIPACITAREQLMGSLTRGGGENVPGIPGACATRYCTYLARCPLWHSLLFCVAQQECTIPDKSDKSIRQHRNETDLKTVPDVGFPRPSKCCRT